MNRRAKWIARSFGLFIISTPLLLTASPAKAQNDSSKSATAEGAEDSGKRRVVLGKFTGPKGKGVRKWVISALKKDESIELVADDATAEIEHDGEDSMYASVAKDMEAHAVITGKVTLRKKIGWAVDLYVHNGEDGTLIEKVHVKGGLLPNLKKGINKNASEALSGPLSQAKAYEPPPPPEPEPEPEEALPEPEEEPEVKTVTKKGRVPLDVEVGLLGYNRSMSFGPPVPGGAGSAPLPYSLDLGPMVHLSADWYPLAHFMTGPATLFGIMLETQQGFGVNTGFEDPDSGESGTFSTVHNSFFAGLRGRIPISDHEIGLFAGWGFHRFAVEEEVQGFSSLVPDVDYKFIQLGLDSRFQLSEAFVVGPQARFRLVSSTGALQDPVWFEDASGNGFSVGLFAGLAVTKAIEVRAGFDFLQYSFSFQGAEETRRDAQSMKDRYLSGWLGVGFRWPAPEIETTESTAEEEAALDEESEESAPDSEASDSESSEELDSPLVEDVTLEEE